LTKYRDILCPTHKIMYGKHLTLCPICVGETMGPAETSYKPKLLKPSKAKKEGRLTKHYILD